MVFGQISPGFGRRQTGGEISAQFDPEARRRTQGWRNPRRPWPSSEAKKFSTTSGRQTFENVPIYSRATGSRGMTGIQLARLRQQRPASAGAQGSTFRPSGWTWRTQPPRLACRDSPAVYSYTIGCSNNNSSIIL